MDQARHTMFFQYGKCFFRLSGSVIRYPDIQGFSLADDISQCSHRFFDWRLWVRTMRIENIHIFQSHPLQTLVKACHQILATSPVARRTRPHVISGFCGNNKFIPRLPQTFLQDTAEIFLCRSIHRTVIIGKIKMCNPIVESGIRNLNKVTEHIYTAEIMPQSQRDDRQ